MLSTRRKRYTFTPWKVGVAGSIVSISFTIPYATLTDVHHISLPFGYSLPTLYFILFIPFVSAIWSLVGIHRRNSDGNATWCFLSLFLSMTSVVFAIVSSMTD